MYAAFDCINYDLLLQRLQLGFGLTGGVLERVCSFLQCHTHLVLYNGLASTVQQSCHSASCKVPCWARCCTFFYTAELSHMIAQHSLCFHQYADNSQIYISTTVKDAAQTVQKFTSCVRAISDWMKLSLTKTEVLWLGPSQQLSQISINDIFLHSTTIRVSESACDLGVIIDSKLSLSSHVASLCWSGFYHLLNVLRLLTQEAARTLVQAFTVSLLDYCNSLLYGLSHSLIRKVKSVQNAVAWLLTGTRRGDHISPVLRQLHRLPV